ALRLRAPRFPAMASPVLPPRPRDQRRLIAATVLASVGGLSGTLFARVGGAAAWTLLLGLGQGAGLALAIFFTVARAPDPVTAASLSGFAQGAGYLIAAAGPLAVGFLHAATGGWTAPVLALLAVAALEFWAGWLAARARRTARPDPQTPGPPRRPGRPRKARHPQQSRRSREPRRHPAESLNPVNLACLANVWYSVGLGGGGLMQALSVPQPWAWAIA